MVFGEGSITPVGVVKCIIAHQAQERAELVGKYHECRARLSDISQAKMSADDTGKLISCVMQGFISDDDVKRAYDKARKSAGIN